MLFFIVVVMLAFDTLVSQLLAGYVVPTPSQMMSPSKKLSSKGVEC